MHRPKTQRVTPLLTAEDTQELTDPKLGFDVPWAHAEEPCSCVPLPVTSHDPAVRARPTVGPPKTIWFPRRPCALKHEYLTVRRLPCVEPKCGEQHVEGISEVISFRREHFLVALEGGLCEHKVDRISQHNTWFKNITSHCIQHHHRTSSYIGGLHLPPISPWELAGLVHLISWPAYPGLEGDKNIHKLNYKVLLYTSFKGGCRP